MHFRAHLKFLAAALLLTLFPGSPAAAAPGDISTVAGDGTAAFGGDGAAATAAKLNLPSGVAVDASGNLFIADLFNHRIRRVDAATGFISTVAGDGTNAFGGDGAAATAAQLKFPNGVAVDASGNLFIADTNNHRIRRVDAATGFISTVAGDGTNAFGGDGAAATAAQLGPNGVAVDASGNLFIVVSGNHRIRRVDAATGFISTVAGNGTAAFGGDGAAATAARLNFPSGVAVDASGNLFIADTNNYRIRRVDAATGFISTVAGTAFPGFSGDGAAATDAQMDYPSGVAVDAFGNLFIADNSNDRIRKVDAATGFISTVAGDGTGAFGGDGAAATAANLNLPSGVAVDASGNLFIADKNNYRIRRVEAPAKPKPAPLNTWSYYHALAYTYYQYYAFFGLYDYATAFYYYYYGIGDSYFYAANGNQALADFSYYNGFGLYFLYLYGTAGYSSYYYYLAFAYYYYFVGVGDFNNANLYYNAYISAAFGA